MAFGIDALSVEMVWYQVLKDRSIMNLNTVESCAVLTKGLLGNYQCVSCRVWIEVSATEPCLRSSGNWLESLQNS